MNQATSVAAKRDRFRHLHDAGLFVMPNPWDVGSARLLASLGFPALATTSSGHAASLGRLDQHVARDELVAHVGQLAAAVDVPLSVDAERCFAEDTDGVADTVDLLCEAGAAGISIEDYAPASGLDSLTAAAERVAAAADAVHRHGAVLTARAENHLYGVDDLDDTVARLRAYRDAGADVVYAPGLRSMDAIGRLVAEVKAPVNVLLGPKVPPVDELAAAGVRRVSTGGALAYTAYGAMVAAAQELHDLGTSTYASAALSTRDRERAFGDT